MARLSDNVLGRPLITSTSSSLISSRSMFASIALVILLALVIAGGAAVRFRRRRRGRSHLLRDLSPVSGEWLTDHRRGL